VSVRTSVTLGVASSVANDVVMKIAGLVAGGERHMYSAEILGLNGVGSDGICP